MHLKNFKIIRPKYEADQETLLEWMGSVHIASRMRLNKWKREDKEYKEFAKKIRENFFRLGLGRDKIEKRGFQTRDCYHQNWDEMEIYNIESSPEGFLLDRRMRFYDEAATEVFEKMYPLDTRLPSHLIHTTCTGYVAPSPAQKLVSSRKQGEKTTVTHAYHMGCYGAIPSIRMGMGHYSIEQEQTDIVHTEFCSLHMNPTFHTTEQLVVQSLFADGFVKYSVGGKEKEPSLKILGVLEQVLEGSAEKMTWNCNNWGFQMSIAKDIPILLRRNLESYLQRLAKKAKIDPKEFKRAHFAIHPGGPKIIEQIADKLQLDEGQITHSKAILRNCGNMSSATLPHVWDQILKDEKIALGELIVSVAFGPGLSISGALFEKR